MRVFLAEKPSLAEGIAKALGVMGGVSARRAQDSWEVGPDRVGWLFGHMFELAEPAAYDEKFKKWSLDALPIAIEGSWKRIPHEDKKKHISALRALVKSAREIVHCGDAGREGQLLVDELLEEFGVNPFERKVRRLWVRSMAEADMIAALRALEPNSAKRGLSSAAWTRQRADWLHGLNYTRLYTVLSGGKNVISVGRVQTPTLKLVVDRDREREAFVPKDHFKAKIRFRHANGEFWAVWRPPEGAPFLDPEGRLLDRAVAERVVAAAKGAGRGAIVVWSEERKTERPPLPFSLSALQSACASAFRMTAKEVLETAQSLYETYRVSTYPRTDSRYLPTALHRDEAPTIIGNLLGCQEWRQVGRMADKGRKTAAWNDAKVSDHHAIIPTREATPERISALPPREAQVFRLIARSFLEQFLPDHVYLARKADVALGGEVFAASGRHVLEVGWRSLRGDARSEEDEEEGRESLPSMVKGDPVQPLDGTVEALRTEPPPAFTDGTLIKAMTSVHAYVTDPELKKRLREADGIGTEATRAEIIETLLRRNFLTRQGKTTLLSTPLGRSVVDAIPKDLCDPGMTALWEGHLRRIEEGNLSEGDFIRALQASIAKRVEASRGTRIEVMSVGTDEKGKGSTFGHRDRNTSSSAGRGTAPWRGRPLTRRSRTS